MVVSLMLHYSKLSKGHKSTLTACLMVQRTIHLNQLVNCLVVLWFTLLNNDSSSKKMIGIADQ